MPIVRPGQCSRCGCTDQRPCCYMTRFGLTTCHWATQEHTVCSRCFLQLPSVPFPSTTPPRAS
jgi:hypothetical protein